MVINMKRKHNQSDIEDTNIKPENILTDTNNVNIDPNKIFPRGIIVMFSGDSAPSGWAFCDGNNGTPDLRSRFVMCGDSFYDKGYSSKASGSFDEKTFFKSTTPITVSVNVMVQDTVLTESQIPSHKHIGGMSYWNSYGMNYGNASDTKTKYQINNPYDISDSPIWKNPSQGLNYYAYTSYTGGGQGHNHQATASSPEHYHNIDVIPPYYLLAFIMKL
ncbi:tail fiber protein [Photorhabdus caribbeanensis]|nr:tail fiber protein [Photorhabdus caribbeanensis]MCC8458071.1 tail fiber protein [Photorhabdus aegyptia]PQQ35430.1 hypothetical protein C6H69_00725 [Photorhabdus luminescens]